MPERYVSDPGGLGDATLYLERKEAPVSRHVDPEKYEAVYSEVPPEYQVVTRDAGRVTTNVVISIPKLSLEDDVLHIDYRIVDDEAATRLILEKLLHDLLFDHYAESANHVELRHLKSGSFRRMPYPAA